MDYLVYLTIYTGDKLPRFYIGSTNMDKFLSGYHGTISSKKYKDTYKKELKENPHLFDSCIVHECKTREEALVLEREYQEKIDAVFRDDFSNMAYAGGKFGISFKGEDHPLYNSHNGKGSFHCYNPVTMERRFCHPIPDGFVKGRPSIDKGVNKGRVWYNNGEKNKILKPRETPPDGFVKGRLIMKEHREKLHRNRDYKKVSKNNYIVKRINERVKRVENIATMVYDLWLLHGRPNEGKFRKIAVQSGFPDQRYLNIVKKLKEMYESSICG